MHVALLLQHRANNVPPPTNLPPLDDRWTPCRDRAHAHPLPVTLGGDDGELRESANDPHRPALAQAVWRRAARAPECQEMSAREPCASRAIPCDPVA